MPLLKQGRIVEDSWTPAVGEPLPDGPVLVDLETRRTRRDAPTARRAPVGVRLKADDDPEELAGYLDIIISGTYQPAVREVGAARE